VVVVVVVTWQAGVVVRQTEKPPLSRVSSEGGGRGMEGGGEKTNPSVSRFKRGRGGGVRSSSCHCC
jgi:hypothetical protein